MAKKSKEAKYDNSPKGLNTEKTKTPYESSSFSVFDSAGVRDTSDVIEQTGVALSLAEIKKADLVLGVFEKFGLK